MPGCRSPAKRARLESSACLCSGMKRSYEHISSSTAQHDEPSKRYKEQHELPVISSEAREGAQTQIYSASCSLMDNLRLTEAEREYLKDAVLEAELAAMRNSISVSNGYAEKLDSRTPRELEQLMWSAFENFVDFIHGGSMVYDN